MGKKRSSNANHPVKKKPIKEPFSFKKLPEHKKKLYMRLGIALAALLVVLIVLIAADYLPHLNGSLNVRGGVAKGVTQDNIVVDKGDSNKNTHKYFNLGTMDALEGYWIDTEYDKVNKKDENVFKRALRPIDENEKISLIYVSGVTVTDESMLSGVKPTDLETVVEGTGAIISEFQYYTSSSGNKYSGYFETRQYLDELSGKYHKFFSSYTPAKYDCCVLVYVSSSQDTFDDLPSDEYMLEAARKAADMITIRQ